MQQEEQGRGWTSARRPGTHSSCWPGYAAGRQASQDVTLAKTDSSKEGVYGAAHRKLCWWQRNPMSLEDAEEIVKLRRVIHLPFQIRMWDVRLILGRVGRAGRAWGHVCGTRGRGSAAQGVLSAQDP